MKDILAKINIKKKYAVIMIASIFAVPFFIISKYLTLVNNDVDINVRKPNYTVVFHSNNGVDNTTSQAFAYGTSQALESNSFTYVGYIFANWNTAANGSGISYSDGQSVSNLSSQEGAIVDLYAQWNVDPLGTCSANTICYSGNGDDGTGSMADQSVNSNNADVVLISSNYSRSGYGFAGWNTMADGSGTNYGPNQTINVDLSAQGLRLYAMWVQSSGDLQSWRGCSSLNSGDVIALTDNRDGNTYAIAKYGDNQCWMMENLRLDLSDQDLEISGLNTNAPTSSFASYINNNHPASTNGFCNANSVSCRDTVYHNTNNTNRILNASYDANDNASSWYSYGNYYNWYTATAGNGTSSLTTSGAVVSGDICPAGWRLPSGYGNAGDFARLDVAMGGTGTSQSDGSDAGIAASKRWRSYPYNFIYSGEQRVDTAVNRFTSNSYATLNSYSSAQTTINLWIKSTSSNFLSNSTQRWRGQTVRCVNNSNYIETGNIHYNANGGSGNVPDDINVDFGTAVAANNAFSRSYYTFIGWNTNANGTGVMVAEGGSVVAAVNRMGITEGGTLTLYAIWSPNYSLVYNGNGADGGSMASADVPVLETGTLPLVASNYSRAGYGFVGWSLDSNAGSKLTNGESVVVYGSNERITVNNAFLNNADNTNTITLYAVWLPESSTKTMQSFGAADCNAMSVGGAIALKDVRDNNVYAVAKLEDGKCWMSENLRLNPSTATISSSNTNSPMTTFVTNASSTVSTESFCYDDDSLCDDQITYNTNAINRNYTASHNSNAVRSSWYSYGVMYNWYTATAGNGNYAMTSGSVTGDICPAGWRLPTGGSGGEFAALYNSSVKPNANFIDSGLVKFPANFIYSGDYSKDKPGGRHAYGRYWSATANNEKSYRLGFGYTGVTPSNTWNKWVGFPVRCVVR